MRQSEWTEFIRRLPPAHQEGMALTTVAGVQIAVLRVVRIEPDCLVVRGRIMGTTEGGSHYVVPFQQISYVALSQAMKEEEITAVFDRRGGAEALPTVREGNDFTPRSGDVAPRENGQAEAAGGANGPTQPSSVNKANLLERLRARRSLTEMPRATGP